MVYTGFVALSEEATVPNKPPLLVDYRVMMNGSPDSVILLDVDTGLLENVNGKASTLFGLPDDTLIGKSLIDLFPPVQPDGTASSTLLDTCVACILDGVVRGFSATFLHAGGRLIPCDIRLIPLPIAQRKLMHIRIVDVTERNRGDQLRRGQAQLLEMIARGAPLSDTLDRLMLLIESQSEGVYCSVLLLDEDGISIRPASGPSLAPAYMAALDGVPIGPDVGSCGTAMYRKELVVVADIGTDPLWTLYRDLAGAHGLRACWSTPIYLDEQHVLGSFAMYYKEVRRPSEDDMRLLGVATHLAGIAIERTRRERELAQHREHLEVLVAARTAELSSALETLSLTQVELVRRDKLAALGSLVAGVAHELNTPIGNSLIVATTMAEHARGLAGSMAEGLRRSRLESYLQREQEASDILIRNLHRAAALVASFKQLAVDQASSQRRQFSLSELLTEIAMSLRISIRDRPIAVHIDIATGLTMDSFPGPLSQVLGSLLENCLVHAFEHGAAGSIHIHAHAVEPEQVAVTIADTGAGIPADLLARVYDPFFTTKLGSGGSGLGLHVAHNIVTDVLGGRIALASEPGAGASFTLTLPTVAPAAATPA